MRLKLLHSPSRIIIPVALSLFLFSALPAAAQYFGRNHVQYERFDFNVLQTNHYDIYHYLNNDTTINNFALMSERWYYRHQAILRDTLNEKNPVFIYKNHSDFQQTTLMDQNVSVGTGGVTEGFKNRVFMPFFESNLQTDHVLGHELVHAFQYNLLKTGGDSLSLYNIANLPLWMVEGMAEYLSLGRTDAHTAMWMRDAVLTQDFPSLRDLTSTNKYFPYRYGQGFWAFVAGLWGDDIVKPLFLTTAKYGYEMAVDSVLGYDEKVVSSMWKLRTTDYYTPFMSDTIPVVGERLQSSGQAGDINISPMLSPDGKYVIFYSERNLFSVDLFLAEKASGRILRTLSSATQRAHVDDYNYIESSATWSPDSRQIAYPVFSKGDNLIVIVDVESGRTRREIQVPGVEYYNYLAWSPDGNSLLISGLADAHSDLFLYDFESGQVEQLTDDAYSEIQPAWSADGSRIVFSTDRGFDTDLEALKFGSYKLAVMDMASQDIEVLDFFPGANNLNPQFSPDGESLYFLSNADGMRNMYQYSLESGEVFKLTKYFTGISGITENAPAMSLARATEDVTYVLFRAGGYYIHKAMLDDFERFPVNPDEVDFAASTLPPAEGMPNSIIAENLANAEIPPVVDISDFQKKPYRPKFSLTTIQQSGIGVGVGSYGGGGTYTGLAGGVAALFGDVLNRNQIYGVLSVNGEIYDIGGQVMYQNRAGRVNYGFGIGHIPYMSSFLGLGRDSLPVEGGQIPTATYDIYNYRTFVDQGSFFTAFPLSQTLRWEASVSFSHYSFRVDRIRTHYEDLGNGYIGYPIYQEKEKLPSRPGFNLYSAMLGFVGDNAQFGITSPVRGRRFRFSAEKMLGELDLYSLTADYRKYFYRKPFTIALRGMYFGRVGKDQDNDLMYPLFLGNEYFVRGYNYNSMTRSIESQAPNADNINIDNLLGNELAVANAEFRLPLTGPEELAQIKSGFLFSDLIVFFDAGKAWNYSFNNPYLNTPQPDQEHFGFDDNPVVTSAGVSLRVNLFGFAILEPYLAYPFQHYNPEPTFGLYISGGGF